jgi:hypothetical protein
MVAEPTDKQKLALVLKHKGLKDHQIAAAMGLDCRESACRLRRRGLAAVDQIVASCNGAVNRYQIIAAWAQALTIPTPSLELALAG